MNNFNEKKYVDNRNILDKVPKKAVIPSVKLFITRMSIWRE